MSYSLNDCILDPDEPRLRAVRSTFWQPSRKAKVQQHIPDSTNHHYRVIKQHRRNELGPRRRPAPRIGPIEQNFAETQQITGHNR